MIAKSLIAAAAVAATLSVALPAEDAKADVDVTIGIGAGGYHSGYGYDDYGYAPGYVHGGYDHGYDDDYGYGGYRPYRSHISCGRGRNIVDNSGFNKVKPVDCSLPGYRYTAWKKGHKYMVRMNGKGNITDIRRIF